MGEVSYKGHRYPGEIIAHCVWLYHRFPLSFREVEELMLVRGVIVTYETIGCGSPGKGRRPSTDICRDGPPAKGTTLANAVEETPGIRSIRSSRVW